MIELLQKIFIGHAHRWETLKEIRVRTNYDNGGQTEEIRFYCRCKVCGKHKHFD